MPKTRPVKITGCGVLPLDQRRGRVLMHPRIYGFTDLIERADRAGVEVWIHSHDTRTAPRMDQVTQEGRVIKGSPCGFVLTHKPPLGKPEERVVVATFEDARILMRAMTA